MTKQYMLCEISHNVFDIPRPIPIFCKTHKRAFEAMIRDVSSETGVNADEIIRRIALYGDTTISEHSYASPSFAFVHEGSDSGEYKEWVIYEVECNDKGIIQAGWVGYLDSYLADKLSTLTLDR